MGALFNFIAAASLLATPFGTLKGHLNIGPITPVERTGQNQTPPPSWYKPYVVLVYRGDKMKVSFAAKRVKINGRGDFSTQLAPGLYWVQVSREDNAPNWRPLPRRQVPIRANQISRVTLDVDTGIR